MRAEEAALLVEPESLLQHLAVVDVHHQRSLRQLREERQLERRILDLGGRGSGLVAAGRGIRPDRRRGGRDGGGPLPRLRPPPPGPRAGAPLPYPPPQFLPDAVVPALPHPPPGPRPGAPGYRPPPS